LSRRCAGLLALFAGLSAPVWAQEAPKAAQTDARADAQTDPVPDDRAIARNLLGRQGHLAPPLRRRCAPQPGGDIVVCAQDKTQFRAQSSADLDPTGSAGTNDGRLTPPDLAPKYPGPVVGRGCFIPPCPKGPLYIIDLSQIPLPPPGSDADKIAKGEMRAR